MGSWFPASNVVFPGLRLERIWSRISCCFVKIFKKFIQGFFTTGSRGSFLDTTSRRGTINRKHLILFLLKFIFCNAKCNGSATLLFWSFVGNCHFSTTFVRVDYRAVLCACVAELAAQNQLNMNTLWAEGCIILNCNKSELIQFSDKFKIPRRFSQPCKLGKRCSRAKLSQNFLVIVQRFLAKWGYKTIDLHRGRIERWVEYGACWQRWVYILESDWIFRNIIFH